MSSVKLLYILVIFVVCPLSIYGSRPFAIHLDTEIGALPEFNSNFQQIANEYLDLLQKIKDAKGPLLDLVVDIPTGFNFYEVTRNGITKLLYQWVLDYVDGVMLMCYRNFLDGPSGLLALSQPCVDYASQNGKKVIIGIETNEVEPAFITFYGTDNSNLENMLGQVDATFRSKSGYAGVAVHDYTGYQMLSNTVSNGNCINKALFDWDNTIISLPSARSAYFSFARSRCITTTILECEWAITHDTLSLTTFWTQSVANGMSMQFLYGNHEWAYTANHPYVLSLVQATKDLVEDLTIQLPTLAPTPKPTTRPTTAPTTKPTSKPTTRPTSAPTTKPTSAPTTNPPTGSDTPSPSLSPTPSSSPSPSLSPSPSPSNSSDSPSTSPPSPSPSDSPSPTSSPSSSPSKSPSPRPSSSPTSSPSPSSSPPISSIMTPSLSPTLYANLMSVLCILLFILL